MIFDRGVHVLLAALSNGDNISANLDVLYIFFQLWNRFLALNLCWLETSVASLIKIFRIGYGP